MPADHAPRYGWNDWSRAADAFVIACLFTALAMDSGRWTLWACAALNFIRLGMALPRPRPTT